MRRQQAHAHLMALIGFVLTGVATAQSDGGDFTITREVIASGGARATGGDYSAVTSTAQPIASGAQSGGDFVVRGGFHVPTSANAPGDALFNNSFEH